MASIKTAIQLHDGVSQQFRAMNMAMAAVIEGFQTLHHETGQAIDVSALNAAQRELQQVEANFNEIESEIRQAEQAQNELNNQIRNSNSSTSSLLKKFGKLTAILAPIIGVGAVAKGGFDRLMGIDTAVAKLEALGHSTQNVEVIMNNSIDSVTGTAFRLEEAVSTAASAVAAGIKPGQQLERYLSLTADAAAIAGTNMSEMGAIFNKVTTGGIIQAEELNQMADRGIPIFQMLADVMGVNAQQIRELASEGEISAATFLNAIEHGFGGAAQTMGISSFQATLDNIGASISRIGANFLNGAGDGQGFFDQVKPLMVDLLNTLKGFEEQAARIGQMFGTAFSFIHENWSTLAPVFWGLTAAVGAYAVALGVKTVATRLADGAAKAFFATLLTNPLFWIAAGVGLLVGWIYKWVESVGGLQIAWKIAMNYIITAWELTKLGIVAGVHWVLNNLDRFKLGFMMVSTAIQNFMGNMKANVLMILQNMVNGAIDIINSFIDKLNNIPFVSIETIGQVTFGTTAAIENEAARQARNADLASYAAGIATNIADRDASLRQMREDILQGWASRQAEISQMQAEVANQKAMENVDTLGNLDVATLEDMKLSSADTAGNTKKIADSVKMSGEDLKHLRDIAERDVINRYTTAEIKVDMSGMQNYINNELDIDGVIDRFGERIEEASQIIAEGDSFDV